jgi:hypothetical protein
MRVKASNLKIGRNFAKSATTCTERRSSYRRAMVLQLYVWGPAFGLASIDAECLATIAYLAQTTSPADYQLIQSSPSAVPTRAHP